MNGNAQTICKKCATAVAKDARLLNGVRDARGKRNGRLQSLDWTSGLDWWTGLVD